MQVCCVTILNLGTAQFHSYISDYRINEADFNLQRKIRSNPKFCNFALPCQYNNENEFCIQEILLS